MTGVVLVFPIGILEKPAAQKETVTFYIYDSDMTKVLTTHDVTWSQRDCFCKDQYVAQQPEKKHCTSKGTDPTA